MLRQQLYTAYSSRHWYPLINVSAIQAVASRARFIMNFAIDAHNHDTDSPSAWAAAGLIDLSTHHSGRQKEVVNNPQQLEGFILYFLMFWSCGTGSVWAKIRVLLSSCSPPHFWHVVNCFIYLFVVFLKLKELQNRYQEKKNSITMCLKNLCRQLSWLICYHPKYSVTQINQFERLYNCDVFK